MTLMNPESEIHKGHRSRMRAKLTACGQSFFDTYELLEMLLYYAVPYKDTNPIAKTLLAGFGSVDGIFSATREELMSISGIGESVADFLLNVADVNAMIGFPGGDEEGMVFDDYNKLGGFAVEYTKDTGTPICCIFFDNGMRIIEILDIHAACFGSAAVKPREIVDAALKNGASVVAVAQTHPHGPLFPTESDMVTDSAIRRELAKINVTVAEHYVICGDRYVGVKNGLSLNVSSVVSPALEKFYLSREREAENA